MLVALTSLSTNPEQELLNNRPVPRSVGLAQLKAGKVCPIAPWGESHWEEYPDVPTVTESGYSANDTLWSGLFVQADTPREIVNALRVAVAAAVADADFRRAMKNKGVRLAYLDGPEFGKFWQADSARLIKTVRRIGKLQ